MQNAKKEKICEFANSFPKEIPQSHLLIKKQTIERNKTYETTQGPTCIVFEIDMPNVI